jgi:hypothetical protein
MIVNDADSEHRMLLENNAIGQIVRLESVKAVPSNPRLRAGDTQDAAVCTGISGELFMLRVRRPRCPKRPCTFGTLTLVIPSAAWAMRGVANGNICIAYRYRV